MAAGTLALSGASTAADSAHPSPAAVTRVELARSDVPGTDLETRLYLAEVPHTLFENPCAPSPLRFLIAYTVKKGAPVIEIP